MKPADVLGIAKSALAINGMASHPVTGHTYLSVTRIGKFLFVPAVMQASLSGEIILVDHGSLPFQMQSLDHYPDQQQPFPSCDPGCKFERGSEPSA